MSARRGRPWLNYALGALCLGAFAAAALVVGPASGSGSTTRRTATAALGVVQVTVSGSGNLESASQLDLGFKAAGTIEHIYARQGEYVTEGKLLASLDPVPAEVTLEQARATLLSAEANLSREEETDGETSSSSGAGASGAGASAPSSEGKGRAAARGAGEPGSGGEAAGGTAGAANGIGAGNGGGSSATGSGSASAGGTASTGGASNAGNGAGSPLSAAAREANVATARAAVKSDRLTVRSDEEALAGTRLYAPQDGTLVSLSGQVGEVVSATGTTRASSSGAGTSGSGSGSSGRGGTGGSAGAGTGSGGSGSGSGGTGGSSSFAVLSDLSSMKLIATLSEAEIHQVKVGQIATVTVEALEGRKFAARVSEVATLPTTSGGVVGYDVAFQLSQAAPGLKPGMSATGEIVVEQEEGLSVPSSAVSGGSVTVLRGGKEVRRAVTTGLAGNSSTIVSSGLRAGETVVLPQAAGSGSSSLSSLLRSRLGGGSGTLGGGGGPFGGGGGGAFRVSGG